MARRAGPSDEEVDRLVADVESAIGLRESFYQRAWDCRLEAQGTLVLYALDTDILHHYFQTDKKLGPSVDNPGGAFQIFRGPADRASSEYADTGVGDVIAHYLVRMLPSNDLVRSIGRENLGRIFPAQNSPPALPLLILPGHAIEARGIYEGFVKNFNDQGRRHEDVKSELTRILTDLDRFEGKARLEEAKAREGELHRLLYTLEAPHSKYREYNDLLLNRLIVNIATASQHPVLQAIEAAGRSEGAMRVFGAFERIVASGETAEPTRWWSTELNKINFPKAYASRDKEALSALEVLNGYLHEHRMKIVLMTMNKGISNLGHKYATSKLGPNRLRRLTFSDHYIRHPRCLFSEPDIFQPKGGGKASDLSAWLDAFLAEVIETGPADLVAFREMKTEYEKKDKRQLAREALVHNRNLHEAFFESWQTHLGNVNLAHVSTTPQAHQIVERVIGGTDSSSVLSELDKYTTDLTETSWYHFFRTAAKLGYRLIGLSAEIARLTKRNPPPIYLGDMEKGDLVLKYIREDGVIKREAEILAILQELEASENHTDKYVSVLLYALLFTFAGRWTVANLIVKRAIYLATSTQKLSSGGSVSGREAYYFAAVSSRLTANNVSDLQTSREWMKKAFEATDKEERATREHGLQGTALIPSTLRFVAEMLSIETARLLFLAAEKDWRLKGEDDLVAEVRALASDIDRAVASADAETIEWIRIASLVNLHGNYFSCALMFECAEVLGGHERERLKHHVVDQSRILKIAYHDDKGASQPSVPDIFLLAYAASFESYDDIETRRIESMFWTFDYPEEEWKDICIMPYDKQRYHVIDKLIRSRS